MRSPLQKNLELSETRSSDHALPEIDQSLVNRVMYLYSKHNDAEWSAGFCAVYLGLAEPEDDCPPEVMNAIAYLVVHGFIRPRDHKNGITFYRWVNKHGEGVDQGASEQSNFFD